jgi:hypothetical protein
MPAAQRYDLIVLCTAPAGETGTLPTKTLKESARFYSGEYDTSIHSNDRLLDGNTTI